MTDQYANKKLVTDAGWKIHHKTGHKLFYEDPMTRKVFALEHAVSIQVVRNQERAARDRLEELQSGLQKYEDFQRRVRELGQLPDPNDEFPPV